MVDGRDFRLADEVRHIQQCAARHDGRIVTVGQLILFSTQTGDAWLLDATDRLAAQLARERQLLGVELLDYCQTGPGASEGLEEQPHYPLHLGVRIKDDAILRVVHEADWDHLLELAAPGTTENAASKACLEDMEFRLAHCPLQAQQ